jgi:hypothetical protein
MPRLTIVIPHWPIDRELDESLAACVSSLPATAEKIIVTNDGTGFARNVNVGLRLAAGEFVCVTGNDSRVIEGDVYDLCIPGTVASPFVRGKPGIEPGGFHGAFWVAPRQILSAVGLFDERFEGAFFEDNGYLMRLRAANVPTVQVPSVQVESRRVGLTMSKVPDRAAAWLALNRERFRDKWGFVPPVTDPELAEVDRSAVTPTLVVPAERPHRGP